MKLQWHEKAWQEYLSWQLENSIVIIASCKGHYNN